MTELERQIENRLTEAGGELVEEFIRNLQIIGAVPDVVASKLREYGPLLYKAGAAHVFLSFDCYPKNT